MATAYTLREATIDDLEALRALAIRTFDEAFASLHDPVDHQQYIAAAYTVEQLRRDIEDPNKHTLLAFPLGSDAAGPCGYVMLNDGNVRPGDDDGRPEDHLEIKRIYVDSGHHGKGVAGLLMRHAVAVALEKKRAVVWLGVNQNNVRACKFYEKQGFVATGTRTFRVGAALNTDWVYTLKQESP